MLDGMTAKQIAGYLKAKKAPDGISFNDGYNVATYGITMDEYRAIDRAMHDAYGLSPKRTPAGVREALRLHGPSASRHHATKKSAEQPYGTPGSLEHVRGVRAREIVRLAAEQVKDPSTRHWLLADERGTFEKAAQKYLEETADKARALGMSNEKVNAEIAVLLALSAVEAFLKRARKGR